jgi:hydroxyacylglutathione hydrolase
VQIVSRCLGMMVRMNWQIATLAPGVLVATSDLYMTTSTVVTAPDGGCLVIDPAITVADVGALAAELRARGLTPVAGFATHPHWDHVLWSAELGDVPRYASPRAAEFARVQRDHLIAEAREEAPGHDPDLTGRFTPLPAGETGIPWHGPRAQAVIHDGHAPGHAAVFLPEAGVLIAGDMCSDVEIPLIDLESTDLEPGDPLGNYRFGLDRLAALPVRLVVPGHGRPGDAAEFRRRVAADLRYLADIGRGEDSGDPRLAEAEDWLRQEHDKQLQYARGRS